MDILETKLMFNGVLKQRGTTSRIIIHHSATNGDVAASTVHQWHLDKGWSGIGYHYLIRTSGVIEREGQKIL
ncbi:MAG: N-acetylmuramoyl-L-alanine amidase [Syntrophomonadaceae bacterium]|nr:N-acetylmuramoyl-L-alanine amidase [Syntrophomonadaceae bacterium]MDD3888370.1 N-acetylmuramoyl-L-alanine amidase [Syntrophomonadaceae bacterium]MDD4548875.1 N-acetylmuramoyl-L-alanine amidase [Syntrophomonadaceae bacterium]